MLINAIRSLNFKARFSTPVEKIPSDIKAQLPVKGVCIVSAHSVIDEEPADFFEVAQDDGATRFVTKFVDGKKVSQEEIYNGKSAGITLFDENGEIISPPKAAVQE